MRVNKLVITRLARGYDVRVETTGLTGKRLRVRLGHLGELQKLDRLIELARDAPSLREMLEVRGGM